jgi:hypothetical protein
VTSPLQNIKSSNPELATTEIAKKLGERWQKMTGTTNPALTYYLKVHYLPRRSFLVVMFV